MRAVQLRPLCRVKGSRVGKLLAQQVNNVSEWTEKGLGSDSKGGAYRFPMSPRGDIGNADVAIRTLASALVCNMESP